MRSADTTLRVFTFSGGFGLPSTGPFALKLLTWLRLARIPYHQEIEDDPRRGPKGKNPWIEIDGQRMGDTELVIEYLGRRYERDLDAHLDPGRAALGVALQRMVEEHLHQIFEYELIVEDAGFRHIKAGFDVVPRPLRGLVVRAFRGHFKKQLFARGIGRHAPEDRTRMGKRDIDAIANTLGVGEGPWALGARPSTVDATIFGFLAPMVFSPLETPVFRYARQTPAIAAYCRRVQEVAFGPDRETS